MRPLAEMLGYIKAGDDVDILSLSPDDVRCAVKEGDESDFQILHPASSWPGLTKYAALFQEAKSYQLRFFHVEDPDARDTVIYALDHLRSESNSAEARALLGTAVATMRSLYNARSGSSIQALPQSFTSQAAWRALRGALCEDGYWLSVLELQCLAACCGCRVTVRMPYGGHGGDEWVDYTLEREVSKVMRCSEEHAAEMTRVLDDHVHVYIPLGMRRGHFSRLLTEVEARQLRERVMETERAGREGGAPAADQGEGAAGAADERHSESAKEDSEAEDEMLYSTEGSSSSESEDESSSEGSSSEGEGSGDGDDSGFMQDGQLQGPVTESVGHLGADAVAQPQEAESVAEPGDAPAVADDPGTTGPLTEDVPMGKENDDDIQVGEEDDGVDDFSDISDDSDLFHVEAKDAWAPRTDEDKDDAIVDTIVPHLRNRTLIPPDGEGEDPLGEKVFGDTATDRGRLQMQSGCNWPKLHCAFKGCRWTCNGPFTPHMEMERLMCVHLWENHKTNEMALVPEEAWPVPDADENYNKRTQGDLCDRCCPNPLLRLST